MHADEVEDDKSIVYFTRVRLGNWFEAAALEEASL